MSRQVIITKADGTQEPFREEKLMRSLKRSGANETEVADVLSFVNQEISDGDTTQEIYKAAFAQLSNLRAGVAASYSLRRAIMDLGPSGFPFEQFMERVLTERGYTTQIGKILKGKCATHEIDILAEDDENYITIEAKFHNKPGVKSDMKVALYVKARYDDLMIGKCEDILSCGKKHSFWLMTNTKFTHNAIAYGKCAGITLIGWSYPDKGNLQEMIEESGLQPITCLTTLSQENKKRLLGKDIVLCKTVKEKPQVLSHIGLSDEDQAKVIKEIEQLYKAGKEV